MAKALSWRDRLALWCLRILTPQGVCAENATMRLRFHSGQSTPEDPKLVVCVRYDKTGQTVVAFVFDPPEDAIETMTEAVKGLRTWVASHA